MAIDPLPSVGSYPAVQVSYDPGRLDQLLDTVSQVAGGVRAQAASFIQQALASCRNTVERCQADAKTYISQQIGQARATIVSTVGDAQARAETRLALAMAILQEFGIDPTTSLSPMPQATAAPQTAPAGLWANLPIDTVQPPALGPAALVATPDRVYWSLTNALSNVPGLFPHWAGLPLYFDAFPGVQGTAVPLDGNELGCQPFLLKKGSALDVAAVSAAQAQRCAGTAPPVAPAPAPAPVPTAPVPPVGVYQPAIPPTMPTGTTKGTVSPPTTAPSPAPAPTPAPAPAPVSCPAPVINLSCPPQPVEPFPVATGGGSVQIVSGEQAYLESDSGAAWREHMRLVNPVGYAILTYPQLDEHILDPLIMLLYPELRDGRVP